MKARYVLTLGLAVALIVAGCENDDMLPVVVPRNCLTTLEDPGFQPDCAPAPAFDSLFCEVVQLEELYRLEEDSKYWIPQLCETYGSFIRYRDSKGVNVKMHRDASHKFKYDMFNGYDNCGDSNSQSRWYCNYAESAMVGLENDELGVRFRIELSTHFQRPVDLSPRTGDRVSIWMAIPGVNVWLTQFRLIVDDGNLTEDNNDGMEFYESFVINGQTFSDVYTTQESLYDAQVYYSRERGLVGWRIGEDYWALY